MDAMTLGARVRELRVDRGLTLAVLAARAGISVSYLNDIEHDRTVPTLGRLRNLASCLELSVRDLFRGVTPYDD
jgi:transcriptional regulator with XRE-family HTH domain